MEGLYVVSASDKVRSLEEDLSKALRELRNEIEEGDFVGVSSPPRVSSSLAIPQDVAYFRHERKRAIRKVLEIREAMPLRDIAEVMKDEITSCTKEEYCAESLPLLLYQFFNDQVQALANLKYMHLIRWARYCANAKASRALFPEYQNRMKMIMAHYQDAVERAKRLSACTESFYANTDTGSGLIKKQDLEIYTSWLVCHMHEVKRIHSLLKVIQWLPYSHRSYIYPESTEDQARHKESHSSMRSALRKLSKVGKAAILLKGTSSYIDPNIPNPPILQIPGKQESPTVTNIAAAAGGGLACDELNLKIPLNEDNIDIFSPILNFLLGCYGIQVHADMDTKAAEMDMFNLVFRKFKKVFYQQEEQRKFPVYDTVPEIMEAGVRKSGCSTTLKKESPWIPYVFLRPEVDGHQTRAMARLKEKNYLDEVLRVFAKFFHIQDGQKVLSCLREHTRLVHEPEHVQSVSVTTHRAQKDTSIIWNKIFNYPSKSASSSNNDILEFETRLSRDELGGINDSEFDISNAVEVLGLEDDDERRHPLVSHGASLSYVIVRHLRIRDLQRTCLSILNYFRSVERTITIYDRELSVEGDKLRLTKRTLFYGADAQGVNSQDYIHNSSTDSKVEENSFIDFSEIENHYDYYIIDDGRIHVQDSKGFFIMYDIALDDFKELEHRLLLVGSHFIMKDKERREFANKTEPPYGSRKEEVNLGAYGHQGVDRFGVLLDLWTNEVAYLENKRQLLDCYFEAYQHVVVPKERHDLAQVIVNIIHQQPRYDFGADYFVQVYRDECVCLRLQCNFIKSILDKQIDDQREYVQRVSRSDKLAYGLPPRIIPLQNIAVNTNRPVLKYVYLLEFHPSLGLISQIPAAVKRVLNEFVHIHEPKTTTGLIAMERHLLEVAQSQFDSMPAIGNSYTSQLQRDLFTDVFIEDPVFVCEVGQSLSSTGDGPGSRTSLKESQKKLLGIWSNLLQVVTLRHRLVEAAHESEMLTKLYKRRAKEMGLDDCHAHVRAVAFEFAQPKPEKDIQQIDMVHLFDDDSKIDRYQPNSLPLAVQEIDEKHMWSFSFRSRDGIVQAIQPAAVERMMTTTMVQVCHKSILATAIIKIENCFRCEGPEGLRQVSSHHLVPSSEPEPVSSSEMMTSALTGFSHVKRYNEMFRRVKQAFVSVQLEKSFLRDKMMNKFLKEKEKKGATLKTLDEIVRLKRVLIEEHAYTLHKRTTQHAIRAQIIGYYFSLRNLMSEFPTTRDSHFVLGDVPDDEEEPSDILAPDPGSLKKRPNRVFSSDGERLINLWYIPHYTEVLSYFQKLPEDACLRSLKMMLRLISALHDVCQYLCAHAKLGSSHARMGSQKLQFSGVTADWGGTEGIGAELREIQRQIDKLGNPIVPGKAAEYIEKKRDVMFLEFDLTVSHLARDTFLAMGKEMAFETMTNCMHFALQNLSNMARSSIFSSGFPLPEPLHVKDNKSLNLVPWRTFMHRFGPFPCMPWPYYSIGDNLQLCISGLSDTERHVVNGEVLGVSLLLEDVLAAGKPDLSTFDNKQERTQNHDVKKDIVASVPLHENGDSNNAEYLLTASASRGLLANYPVEAVRILEQFLLVWSCLETMKLEWGSRRLGTSFIRTRKQYKSYRKAYESDVLQVVYKQIAAKRGFKGNDYMATTVVNDYEQLVPPRGVSEFEVRARQLVRLLEALESTMVHDVIRRLSREQTLVIAERSREDATLPTDLWKKPIMKENFTMPRPQMVEDFVDTLMTDHFEDGDTVSFPKEHLNKSLMMLSSQSMQREKLIFNSYTGFYENLLRQQNQSLYLKEQEIKQLKDDLFLASHNTEVDADCLLADKSHDLILEITALRAKVVEMSMEIRDKEKELYEKLKVQFSDLIIELFNNAFSMKNRFQQFKSSLYDDVLNQLGDVRKQASESMKKLRMKTSAADDTDVLANRLIKAEELREAQWESKNLATMILKLKSVNHWNRTKAGSRSTAKLAELKQRAEIARKECLEMNLIHEEKELLMKQELNSMRKALSQLEKECQVLRRKLTREQKLKIQRSHAQVQEAISHRQIDMARSSNIDKLIAELDEKEERLRELTELNDHDLLLSRRSQADSKKSMRNMMSKLSHERALKSEAFDRVEELQRQVEEYEDQITEITRSHSGSHHTSCFPLVPGGRTSPQRRMTQTSARHYRSKSSGHDRMLSVTPGRSGHQSLQLPKCSTPDDLTRGRPRTVSARIRMKLKESVLADLEPVDRR